MPSDAASHSRRQDITSKQLQKRISSPTGICFTKMPLFLLQTNLFSLDNTKHFHHLVLFRITNVLIADCASFNREKITNYKIYFNAQFSLFINKYVCYTIILDMFRALTCPSSGGKIVFTQYLVTSLSVKVCTVHWLRADWRTDVMCRRLQRAKITDAV